MDQGTGEGLTEIFLGLMGWVCSDTSTSGHRRPGRWARVRVRVREWGALPVSRSLTLQKCAGLPDFLSFPPSSDSTHATFYKLILTCSWCCPLFGGGSLYFIYLLPPFISTISCVKWWKMLVYKHFEWNQCAVMWGGWKTWWKRRNNPLLQGKLVYVAVSPGAGGVRVDAWRVPGWMMEEVGYEYKEYNYTISNLICNWYNAGVFI